MTTYRKRLVSRALVAALLFLSSLAPISASSQPQSSTAQIGDRERNALNALASALTAGPDRTDAVLAEMGFPLDSARRRWPGFDRWPALRKIEAGYFAAIEATGPESGERYLNLLSRIVAQDQSRAIRYDRALARFFPETGRAPVNVGDRRSVPFAIARAVPTAPPSAEVRRAILAIEPYLSNLPGGLAGTMARCCNVPPDQIYEILRQADSPVDAISRAVTIGRIPPGVRERMLRAVQIVAEASNAVRSNPALAPYLAEIDGRAGGAAGLTRPVDPPRRAARRDGEAVTQARQAARAAGLPAPLVAAVGNGDGCGGSSAGGGGGGGGGNQARYLAARDSISPKDSPRAQRSRPRFRAARASGRGFGGILFGNTVDGSALGRPLGLYWSAEPAADGDGVRWGRFDVRLANGEVAPTRRFREEDAYAAIAILNGGQGFEPLDVAGGEGVGLAGLHHNAIVEETFLYNSFLVHPALFGLSLGDMAILADARGFMMGDAAFAAELERAGVPASLREEARRWQGENWGFYKITDAPLAIVLRDGMVTVERPANAAFPERLRQSAFLTFQACGQSAADCSLPESATPFYRILPALIATFPDYARLNQFAEIFAIVRWARLAGVQPEPVPAVRRDAQRLLVIITAEGGIRLAETEGEALDDRFAACPDALCRVRIEAMLIGGTAELSEAQRQAVARVLAGQLSEK